MDSKSFSSPYWALEVRKLIEMGIRIIVWDEPRLECACCLVVCSHATRDRCNGPGERWVAGSCKELGDCF